MLLVLALLAVRRLQQKQRRCCWSPWQLQGIRVRMRAQGLMVSVSVRGVQRLGDPVNKGMGKGRPWGRQTRVWVLQGGLRRDFCLPQERERGRVCLPRTRERGRACP